MAEISRYFPLWCEPRVEGAIAFVGGPDPVYEASLSRDLPHDYVVSLGYDPDSFLPMQFEKEFFDKDAAKYQRADTAYPFDDFSELEDDVMSYFSDVIGTCSPVSRWTDVIGDFSSDSATGRKFQSHGVNKGIIIDEFLSGYKNSQVEDTALFECFESFEAGCAAFTYATISPKMELLPALKVEKGKVRSFQCMSLDHYVWCLILFKNVHDTLAQWFVENLKLMKRLAFPIYPVIGASAQHQTYSLALSADFNESLDVGGWDGSLPAWCIWLAGFVIWRCLHPKYQTPANFVRWFNIFNCLIYTYYVHDGHLYRKKCGMPSGAYFTLLVNTICHLIIRIICLRRGIKFSVCLLLGDDVSSDTTQYDELASIYKVLGFAPEIQKGFVFLQCEKALKRTPYGLVWVLQPSLARALSSACWKQNRKRHNGRSVIGACYERVCGLRTQFYPNDQAVDVLERILDFLADYQVGDTPFRLTREYIFVSPCRLSREELDKLWYSPSLLC